MPDMRIDSLLVDGAVMFQRSQAWEAAESANRVKPVSLQVVFFRRTSWAQTLLWLICCASVTVLALGVTVHAADFTGPVVSVLDGDTIEILHNIHAERIRLNRIDCIEKGQAYG